METILADLQALQAALGTINVAAVVAATEKLWTDITAFVSASAEKGLKTAHAKCGAAVGSLSGLIVFFQTLIAEGVKLAPAILALLTSLGILTPALA